MIMSLNEFLWMFCQVWNISLSFHSCISYKPLGFQSKIVFAFCFPAKDKMFSLSLCRTNAGETVSEALLISTVDSVFPACISWHSLSFLQACASMHSPWQNLSPPLPPAPSSSTVSLNGQFNPESLHTRTCGQKQRTLGGRGQTIMRLWAKDVFEHL